jgi:bifunctional non-homologous end joining protein LigD
LRYFPGRPGFALPAKGTKLPATDAWFHEVKYDGYRMMVARDGDRVRLISKGGNDYTKRFPWNVEAAHPTEPVHIGRRGGGVGRRRN